MRFDVLEKEKNGWISTQGGPRKTSYKLSYGAPITSMVISPHENTFKYRAIYRNNASVDW